MGDFFKKNLWLLNLVAIAIMAWMTGAVAAEAVGVFIASKFLPKKAAPLHIKSTAKGLQFQKTLVSRYAMSRNPFNADRPKEEGEGGDSQEANGEQGGDSGEGPQEADIGITLLGTLYSPTNPAWSLATIRDGTDTVIVKEGSKVLSDTAVVEKIAQRYIVVKKGNTEYVVRLWAKKDSHSPKTIRPKRHFIGGPVPSYRRHNKYSKGVRKVGPYEYEVDRDMIMQDLQNLAALGMQARIIPNYRNGKYDGFRLVGVRPNSLYAALGIRSGDIVQRVNGQDLNSPNKALELFNQLQTASTINVDIIRYGKKVTLTYKVK